jgi:mevalonate pyrophosphate decarboxylase
MLIDFVLDYNSKRGSTLAAYTFDAGPNCCVFIDEENVEDFLREFNDKFGLSSGTQNGVNYTIPLKQYKVSEVGGGPRQI